MDATDAACDGLWVRDLLATAGPFVLLAALLRGLAYLVLDPMPPCLVVLTTGPARSDVARFGARIFSVAPSGSYRPEPRRQRGLEVQILAQKCIGWKPPGLIVGLRATNSDESTTGAGRSRPALNPTSTAVSRRSRGASWKLPRA
jgi:hypothetical protein